MRDQAKVGNRATMGNDTCEAKSAERLLQDGQKGTVKQKDHDMNIKCCSTARRCAVEWGKHLGCSCPRNPGRPICFFYQIGYANPRTGYHSFHQAVDLLPTVSKSNSNAFFTMPHIPFQMNLNIFNYRTGTLLNQQHEDRFKISACNAHSATRLKALKA